MDWMKKIEACWDDYIRDLGSLIEIESTLDETYVNENEPYGLGPKAALVRFLEIAERMGFDTRILENQVGYVEYIPSNCDSSDEDYIGVLGHVDVVPTDGQIWSVSPYQLTVAKNRLLGRGVVDDKGPLLAALYGLKILVDEGCLLEKKIRIIVGTNEENGSSDIPVYLKTEAAPSMGFTPDGAFPMITSEKGALLFRLKKAMALEYEEFLIQGGKQPNMVPDMATAHIKTKSTKRSTIERIEKRFRGKASHGSEPDLGINAITGLLQNLIKSNTDEHYNNHVINPIEIKVMVDLAHLFHQKFWGQGIFSEDFLQEEAWVDPSMRTSLNLGTLKWDLESLEMFVDIRYLGDRIKRDRIVEEFTKKFTELGYEVQCLFEVPALHFPKEHPLVKTLSGVYTSVTGEQAKTIHSGGSTYAKVMPGIIAFGPVFPERENMCHMPDESILIDDMKKGLELYGRAIEVLSQVRSNE